MEREKKINTQGERKSLSSVASCCRSWLLSFTQISTHILTLACVCFSCGKQTHFYGWKKKSAAKRLIDFYLFCFIWLDTCVFVFSELLSARLGRGRSVCTAAVLLSSSCLDSWLGACSHMEGALTPRKLLTAKTFKSQVVRWPAKESHCHCRSAVL